MSEQRTLNFEQSIIPPANYTDTSRQAAVSVAGMTRTLRNRVYEYVKHRGAVGATNDEMSSGLELRLQTVTARCNELQKMGLLFNSGSKRRSNAGRKAIVWKAQGNQNTKDAV